MIHPLLLLAVCLASLAAAYGAYRRSRKRPLDKYLLGLSVYFVVLAVVCLILFY